MNVHITIDLPDGRSAEFRERPVSTSYATYRDHARKILDEQYEAAKRWLDDEDARRKAATAEATS